MNIVASTFDSVHIENCTFAQARSKFKDQVPRYNARGINSSALQITQLISPFVLWFPGNFEQAITLV